jgi:serine-type D-Ala-D-Ala carboxypeptidase/endopeptidase (penicillin-binding protein 4)
LQHRSLPERKGGGGMGFMKLTELLLLNFRCVAHFIVLIFIQQEKYSMLNFQLKRLLRLKQLLIINYSLLIILSSCSIQQKISRSAKQVINDSSLLTAHVGISIYEPATGKYWYNYQGDKYFVPASNTKIPTCYAAMKYLGDSLVGLRYGFPEEDKLKSQFLIVQPTGDPTFLHEDYKKHPVFDFLENKIVKENFKPGLLDTIWKDQRWGSGWAWNDYQETYMAERSSFPIYGNIVTIKLVDSQNRVVKGKIEGFEWLNLFSTGDTYFDSILNWSIQNRPRKNLLEPSPSIDVARDIASNLFSVTHASRPFSQKAISFFTASGFPTLDILKYKFKKEFGVAWPEGKKNMYGYIDPYSDFGRFQMTKWNIIHSQATDSLLKPMMHRSDNFFAEQSLLMVSNERLGIMNDAKIIDTLLKTDFKDLPQKPRWVDGSGLSRYNLFTPQDFVAILNKMKNEFGMERIKVILPTGGEGTISSYYKADSNYIFVKTGTLSGVVALSGFLYTKKGKLLIFSTLVNNHQASATAVRRAVEKFLQGIRQNF